MHLILTILSLQLESSLTVLRLEVSKLHFSSLTMSPSRQRSIFHIEEANFSKY